MVRCERLKKTMRNLTSHDWLTISLLCILTGALLVAGCAMDKFKLSFDRGVIAPKQVAPEVLPVLQ